MDFSPSPRAADLTERVRAFVDSEIEPVEADYQREITRLRESGGDAWTPLPIVKELQSKARAQGLWNLFLPAQHAHDYAERFGTDGGAGLSNVDYAPIAEQTGRSFLAPLIFNCNAPDTGNMEVLLKYGTEAQRAEWLEPLLDGRIRSGFAMTEPDVASSDATNMAATAVLDGDEVVVNGRKWWTTGAGNPECKIFVFMGLTDPEAHRHARHTMVLVPRDAPGVKVERALTAMGMYDEPLGHAEVSFTDVRVPASNVLLGPGRAFEIAQGRLGPGPRPPLHAADRPRGEGARARLPARDHPGGVRPAAGQARRQRGADRRRPDRHRPGPACSSTTPPGSSTPRGRPARSRRSARSRSRCPTWRSRSSTWRSSCTAAPACPRTSRSPPRGPPRARSGSPTGPTRCTGA